MSREGKNSVEYDETKKARNIRNLTGRKISFIFFKMTDHAEIWPDNSSFWPDIVRWPAVISRPV